MTGLFTTEKDLNYLIIFIFEYLRGCFRYCGQAEYENPFHSQDDTLLMQIFAIIMMLIFKTGIFLIIRSHTLEKYLEDR